MAKYTICRQLDEDGEIIYALDGVNYRNGLGLESAGADHLQPLQVREREAMIATRTLQNPLAAALNEVLWRIVADAHDEALDEDAKRIWRQARARHEGREGQIIEEREVDFTAARECERRKLKARRSKRYSRRSKHKAQRRPEDWKPHREHEGREGQIIAGRLEA